MSRDDIPEENKKTDDRLKRRSFVRAVGASGVALGGIGTATAHDGTAADTVIAGGIALYHPDEVAGAYCAKEGCTGSSCAANI